MVIWVKLITYLVNGKWCIVTGKLKGANILIALFNEVYVLAKVDYPNRIVKAYLSDKDAVVEVDVVELFKLTQSESCLVWCEL